MTTLDAESGRLVLAMVNACHRLRSRGVESVRICITEEQCRVLVEVNALSTSAAGPTFRRCPVVVYDFGGYAFCPETGLREEIR